MSNGKKKSKQLGMANRIASSRLRKMLLWKYVCMANENICYRCEKEIQDIDDLTVDHKKAWLNSIDPPNLFFDLDNIAFSHLSCNSQHNWQNVPNKVQIRKEISIAGNKAQDILRKTNPEWFQEQRKRNKEIIHHRWHIKEDKIDFNCKFCKRRKIFG